MHFFRALRKISKTETSTLGTRGAFRYRSVLYFSENCFGRQKNKIFCIPGNPFMYKVLTEKSHKILESYATISVSAVIGTLWQCRADGCHYHPRRTSEKISETATTKTISSYYTNQTKIVPITIYPTNHLLRLTSDNDQDTVFLATF